MRLRAFALVLLTLSVGLSGCGEDEGGPRLARPTNATAGPYVPPSPTNPPLVLDFNDPGYRMNATWSAGDGWDWESNHSRWRAVRVLETRTEGSRTLHLLEESAGWAGSPTDSRQRAWVDGTSWMRLNVTDAQGFLTVIDPGQPVRYLRNGSYNYTERLYDAAGRLVEETRVLANVAYVNNDVIIRLPWGNAATGKFDHRLVTVDKDRNQARTQVTQWVSREYANLVQYQVNLDETYTLTAAKVGNRTFRELRAT